MSYATISKSLSAGHLPRLKKGWQRSLAIEHTLIALLVAFTTFQVLFVVGTSPSPVASAHGAPSPLSAPVEPLNFANVR